MRGVVDVVQLQTSGPDADGILMLIFHLCSRVIPA